MSALTAAAILALVLAVSPEPLKVIALIMLGLTLYGSVVLFVCSLFGLGGDE